MPNPDLGRGVEGRGGETNSPVRRGETSSPLRGFGRAGSQTPSELIHAPLHASRVPEWSEPERPSVSDWASALSWGRDESELVTELQAGSETAFDWLVTHYHGPVYSLILSMLGDVSDAADGTQEVFLKAFRGIHSFRQGSSLKTWLYRIAIREALNHKRWFKRHLQKNVSIDAEPEEGRSSIEIEDEHATPFDLLAAHEIQDAVQNALQQVAEVFRSAVILRDLEGLSYEEIAEVLDCSVGTVKSRILRGRRALKELLEPLLTERETPRGENTSYKQRVCDSDGNNTTGSGMTPRRGFAPRLSGLAHLRAAATTGNDSMGDDLDSSRSRFSREETASGELP